MLEETIYSIDVFWGDDTKVCFKVQTCLSLYFFYQNVMNLYPPVPTIGSPRAVYVSLCLCDNACKRSLAICHKSRKSCPISRLLSVPIYMI